MDKTLQAICNTDGRVDRVVQDLTGLSRAGVRGLFDHECVRVNRQACTNPAARCTAGDVVEVHYDPRFKYKEKPRAWSDPAFEILHEDEHLIVVNKSAHVLTVPSNKRQTGTLVHALERYFNAQPRGRKSVARAHVVHRLDLGVSGVLVVAKTQRVAEQIRDQFEARKPERLYRAVVMGEMPAKSGTFRSYLATDANLNRYSTKDTKKGELAITHYEVESISRGATLVNVRLETGRRNQIRVHFAEAGHPVLGDPRYPRDAPGSAQHPRWRAKRLALHAAMLGLKHPITGEALRFEAPLPPEFAAFEQSRARA